MALRRRLGHHHLAYLRAIALGIEPIDAARRYLQIEHGRQVVTVHREVVELAASIARRRGDSRWRLIGRAIPPPPAPPALPSIDEWAEQKGLHDWSADELQAMYAETFGDPNPGSARKRARDERLRTRRLALLTELEMTAAERATPADAVDGWLPPRLAAPLISQGVTTLGSLQARIEVGGRWWHGLPAVGPTKARRLQAQVEQLLGPAPPPAWPALAGVDTSTLSGATRTNRPAAAGAVALDAGTDLAAVRSWIAARAGSPATARAYEREAERWMLFMVRERRRAMADATVDDCRAYLDFLSNVPARWISRRRAARFSPGWAPFSGPLTVASQRHAITIVHSMHAWLVDAGYVATNPWTLIQRRIGDAPDGALPHIEASRALTPAAWRVLLQRADAEGATDSGVRMRWLLCFGEATGLRAAELLRARRGDFIARGPRSWWLRVHGKGAKLRAVPVPSAAMDATRRYFASRGADFDTAAPDVPLLASTVNRDAPLAYPSLHAWFKAFVRRALKGAELPEHERAHALAASTHWLRHTHATRAAEGGVPPEVLQANLGQADPRTTAGYYRAQQDRQQNEMERVFGVNKN